MAASGGLEPGAFALVTLFDTDYEVGFLCTTSHIAYAQRHGYRQHSAVLPPTELRGLCDGRAPQWGKLALLRELLRAALGPERGPSKPAAASAPWAPPQGLLSEVQWLVWVDADAILVDHDVRLEDLLGLAGSGRDLIIGEDMSCASAVNTGVFFLRVCSWSLDLLDEVWDCDPRLHHGPFHEQTALSRRLQREAPEHEERSEWWWSWLGGPRRKALGEHAFVLDCGTLNYKHPEQARFAVHFVDNPRAGPSKAQRAERVLRERWVRGAQPLAPGTAAPSAAAAALWEETAARGFAAEAAGWPHAELAELEVPHRQPLQRSVPATALRRLGQGSPLLLQMPGSCPLDEWSLEALESRCGEELVTVAPLAPPRCSDGPVDLHRVKMWQLCSYARGAFPPLHPILSGRDGGSGDLWRACAWRPPGPKVQRLPFAPEFLEDALGARAAASPGEPDQWAELRILPPGAVVRPHRDVHDTHVLLAQLDGASQVVLCPPEAGAFLSAAGASTFDETQSSWDPWAQHGGCGGGSSSSTSPPGPCEVHGATLRRGDALVVPVGWWHSVRALSASAVLVRHVANRTNANAFTARQRAAQEASEHMRRPRADAVALFAPALKALRTPGNAAWLGLCPAGMCSGVGPPERGSWCIAHIELMATDGRVLYTTRSPAGTPPRLFRAGDRAQHWTASLAGAAVAASRLGSSRRVALAPALVFAVAPEVPLPAGSTVLASIELLTILGAEPRRAAGSASELVALASGGGAGGGAAAGEAAAPASSSPQCRACGASGAPLLCSRCRQVRYCGAECQRKAWPAHKAYCRALASEARPAEASTASSPCPKSSKAAASSAPSSATSSPQKGAGGSVACSPQKGAGGSAASSPQKSASPGAESPTRAAEAAGLVEVAQGLNLAQLCSVGEAKRRGIVICAGGPYLGLAWLSLRLLRDFCKCSLPAEIWHLPGEVSPAAAAAMEGIPGVVLRELTVPLPRRRPEIWGVKPLAVAASSFREVLLLDADNVPAADPSPLFEAADYARTGALFWPDYPPYPEKEGPVTWHALSAGRWTQRPSEISWEMESGQAVIDKEKSAPAVRKLVELALHLGELAPHLPGDGGDKDLFQISWALEGCPFTLCKYTPAAAGVEMEDRRANPRGPFVGHTMVHHSPDGEPLFLHRTIDKHEDPLALAWRFVASRRGARGKVGEQPALELERIFPDARIKARIVPRDAAAVDVADFDAYVPRGGALREAFAGLAEELKRERWAAA